VHGGDATDERRRARQLWPAACTAGEGLVAARCSCAPAEGRGREWDRAHARVAGPSAALHSQACGVLMLLRARRLLCGPPSGPRRC
jgi:hypothetical protein